MKKECSYMRVGTVYYKTIYKPNLYGDKIKLLVRWDSETIKQDHGKDFLSEVPKYDGFGFYPGHIDYKYENLGFINKYHPIKNQPASGKCDKILDFIRHIFGEQYELGLDYITLLYLQPTRRLPILCLVSKKRNTGKSTFLMFLKAIFENNMTINTNEDFRSNFNADWSDKLIVGVDEALLDRREDSERIKNLSTAKTYKTEAKNKDKFEEVFIGKFILCSNNEDNFIIIEPEETRYWIRKIEPFTSENENLLNELEKEIPQFLHFLSQRKLVPPKVITRMWFSSEQIATDALKRVKRKFLNRAEMELLEIFRDIMEAKEPAKLCFTNTNVKALLERANIKLSRNEVRKILEEKFSLTQQSNSLTYKEFYYDGTGFIYERDVVGRYYSLKKEDFDKIYDELMNY
jgi:hypothetical protein